MRSSAPCRMPRMREIDPRKACARQSLIDGGCQPGCQIAAISRIHWYERILPLIEFVQVPSRCGGMQMSHALPSRSHGTFRHNHRQPLDHAPVPLHQSTRFEPKNSHGQRAINDRLRFPVVYSHDRKARAALWRSHPRR